MLKRQNLRIVIVGGSACNSHSQVGDLVALGRFFQGSNLSGERSLVVLSPRGDALSIASQIG